ncbi:hypothetical protein CHARACLAT_026642 [Characodon lateralis]|uniref:Uncharacterized protein n=1 Tax=Characodon lateralis TaxID=208331 RepID=A0ABU7EYI3_9TELE|nr:hypothetical protein [Characodon lateralis]
MEGNRDWNGADILVRTRRPGRRKPRRTTPEATKCRLPYEAPEKIAYDEHLCPSHQGPWLHLVTEWLIAGRRKRSPQNPDITPTQRLPPGSPEGVEGKEAR